MSMYDSLYGREGRGIGPNEPEKKGFARFCQMVGRDLGQLLGTNLLVCLLCLPAALGVSLGVTLLSLPLTIVLGAATGLLAGLAAMQTLFPALRSEYDVELHSIPRPAAPEQPLSAQEQKKRSRANASLTDMNGQMAGATQMNTDLANGESKLWVLEDPEGFEQAYGALSENLGADWAGQLIDWSDQPVLSSLDLGSYNTAADGSQSVTVQSCFARCKIAVLDPADGLWHALSS